MIGVAFSKFGKTLKRAYDCGHLRQAVEKGLGSWEHELELLITVEVVVKGRPRT